MTAAAAPIGVFDSGVGGLTVLRALREQLPGEDFIYLGDTARLPYGSKGGETVRRYALQAAGLLARRGIKALVVACNTASAAALGALAEVLAPMPVFGVIDPGAAAAVARAGGGRIAVIATEGTVRGNAYPAAIARLDPTIEVRQAAGPLMVALAEEGWCEGPVVEAVVSHYLQPLLADGEPARVLLLGCTHFPVLAEALAKVAGPGVALVDSAATTAEAVAVALRERGLLQGARDAGGKLSLLATDSPQRFAQVGSRFVGARLDEAAVELVDLRPQ